MNIRCPLRWNEIGWARLAAATIAVNAAHGAPVVRAAWARMHAMSAPDRNITLLGPQRAQPSVASAVEALGVDGPLCVITAGWQEREGEIEELAAHCARPVVDLALYRRTETLFRRDPGLFDAHRERQNWLRELQRVYRIRLRHTLEAAQDLLEEDGDPLVLEHERRAAIAALRTLDRYHLKRIHAAREGFVREQPISAHPAVAAEREEIARVIEASAAVLIAGGHVAILVNRMRLLDLAPLIAARPIIAWSAGAMALTERIVLFHDSPPQGPGDAEVLDEGLGFVRNLVTLPHASQRLHLHDRIRVALFARRFSPAACLTFDPGARVSGDGRRWNEISGSYRLTPRGQLSLARPVAA